MQDFVKHSFPKNIVDNIELESLICENTSYTDKRLRKYFSDLVYTCTYNKQTSVKIALLFEHKSKAVEFPHFQLLTYILRIWDSCVKNKEKRIIVIPIIFYHGKEPWIRTNLHEYFGNVDQKLKTFIPNFDYLLIDTSKLSDSKIKGYDLPSLRIAIFLLKYIFDKKVLEKKIESFFETQQASEIEDNDDFVALFYQYLLNNLNSKQMETIRKKIDKNIPTKTRSILIDQFIERHLPEVIERQFKKGEEKGLEEGVLKTAKKGIRAGFSNEIIKEMTDLTDYQIDKLRQELSEELVIN